MAKSSKSVATAATKATGPAKSARKTKRAGPKKRALSESTLPETNSLARSGTKLARVIALLGKEDGATIGDLTKATGWQAHSVRGAISGTLKKNLGLTVVSEAIEGRGRVYRITNND